MSILQSEKRRKNLTSNSSNKEKPFIVEIAKTVVIALALVVIIRYFLIQPFYVKGASMEPNFYDHEYLVIDELSYRFRNPARGEVVVIRYPRDPSQFFIKRVIGLPGETVEIHRDQIVITSDTDAVILEEPYLDDGVETSGDMRIDLGPDEFFVLGDNRQSSLDSRTFGPVLRKGIIGRTWIRVWPFGRFAVFSPVEYPEDIP